jgi:hypothetical protein
MKVQIADVVVRTREVELPDQCPHCNANLTYGKGYAVITLEHVCRDAHPGQKGYLLASWAKDDLSDWLEEGQAPITWVGCASCFEPVVQGKFQALEEVPSHVQQRTAWSASIGQLFFKTG